MCEKSVKKIWSLIYVYDWFVTPKMLEDLDNDKDLNSDTDHGELVKWYDDYKQRKDQKAQIKEELVPIAWHSLDGKIGVCKKMRKKSQYSCLMISEKKV